MFKSTRKAGAAPLMLDPGLSDGAKWHGGRRRARIEYNRVGEGKDQVDQAQENSGIGRNA